MEKIQCGARNGRTISEPDCVPNPDHPSCQKCDSPNKNQVQQEKITSVEFQRTPVKAFSQKAPIKDKWRMRRWLPDGGKYEYPLGDSPYFPFDTASVSSVLVKVLDIPSDELKKIFPELNVIMKDYFANKELKDESRKLTRNEIRDIYKAHPHILKKRPVDRGGRPDEWPLKTCIIHLANIFERITAKDAGFTRTDKRKKAYAGRFFDFIIVFLKSIDSGRPWSNVQVGKQIERSLSFRKQHKLQHRNQEYRLIPTILSEDDN